MFSKLIEFFFRYIVSKCAMLDLHSDNGQGPRPIHWASRNGHVAVVDMLLSVRHTFKKEKRGQKNLFIGDIIKRLLKRDRRALPSEYEILNLFCITSNLHTSLITGWRSSRCDWPQGFDPADDGLHVRSKPDGRLPSRPRRPTQSDRHEWGLGLALGRLQGLPVPDADAYLFWVRPSKAWQLWIVTTSSGLYFRKSNGR